MYDLASGKDLNVGNSYTYTLTAEDKAKYKGFFVTTAATITVSDGVNSVAFTLAANEELPLNNTTTTLVGTVTNVVVFTY